MPPRYAYWTIIVDDQATAFRAGALEDLMPTFNRLKEKQPTAKLMWFQNGKLWPSRLDARAAMDMRGDRGRDRDPHQRTAGGDKPSLSAEARRAKAGGLSRSRDARPEWKPKAEGLSARDRARSTWKPKPYTERRDEKPEWKPKPASGARLEWKPKSARRDAPSGASAPASAAEGKRKWVPKAEYKKATGTEAKRDEKWRPGGEHKDPRQKYKDAKKAKWTRFKQAIRSRSDKKRS